MSKQAMRFAEYPKLLDLPVGARLAGMSVAGGGQTKSPETREHYDQPETPTELVGIPEGKPKGLRWTRQSVRHYDGRVVPGKDPSGRPLFWFTVTPIEETEEGTDRWSSGTTYP